MSLNKRQERLYADVAVIYKPVKQSGTTAEGFKKDPTYTLVASDVSCKFFRRGETSLAAGVGRMPKINDYQLDRIHTDVDQEVGDAYAFVITNNESPYAGYCFMVDGVPTRRQDTSPRRPNYCMSYVKHVYPRPNGIAQHHASVVATLDDIT